MTLERLHRRLAVLMALAGLLAFAAGAGLQLVSAVPAAAILIAALFWQPSPELSARLDRLWIPLAGLLVIRAGLQIAVFGGDVVIPVVDLLLLLLCAEALRNSETPNDVRLYALSFALILASTAYHPGILFAISFLVFVVLGSIALAVGLLRRKVLRFGGREPSLDRSFLFTSVVLSGATIAMAVAVFVTFPRVTRGWAGRGDVSATSIAGFSDEISLGQHGATIEGNPEIVLRVEFPDGRPGDPGSLHWRGRSYDHFDGVRWSRTRGGRPSAAPLDWYADRWPDRTLEQEIWATPLDIPVMFGLHPVVAIEPESDIRPMYDDVGDFFFWGEDPQPRYRVLSVAESPPPDSLRIAEGGFSPDPQRYLQLPDLPDRVGRLADSLVVGQGTRYDRVEAVRRWFTAEFGYTRQLPATARETSLDHFLFERRAGHCEYFSSAMVVLLRSVGIPARNVNGFLGGQWNEVGGYLAVSQNEAHSWVEVWFPGWGWVQFDPTPADTGGGSGAAAWGWPGLLWFDGIQHRWNRWVLNYTIENQIDLVDRLQNLLGNDPAGGGADPDRSVPGWIWGVALGIVLLGSATYFRSTGRPGLPPESRIYRRLVRSARRAGILEDGDPATPGELLNAIAERRPAAVPAARIVIDGYQDIRFGGRPRTPETESRLGAALATARRALLR